MKLTMCGTTNNKKKQQQKIIYVAECWKMIEIRELFHMLFVLIQSHNFQLTFLINIIYIFCSRISTLMTLTRATHIKQPYVFNDKLFFQIHVNHIFLTLFHFINIFKGNSTNIDNWHFLRLNRWISGEINNLDYKCTLKWLQIVTSVI